ncbi:MAG: dienelactone hydrolase family protein [Alphaproteobacteria bacterium]|nr:dienelactone hydrolase family protein [Alphaproteobacteria bacterium]
MSCTLTCAIAPVADPKTLLILLHGYGANGQDLIGLAPAIQQNFPDTTVIAPDAPHPCVQNPMGREWFSLEELSLPTIQRGVEAATPDLLKFLASVTAAHDLAYHDLILMGFSQGTMMALHAVLHLEECPRAVVGFSGLLAHTHPTRRTENPCPIHLIHGDQDPVVPESGSLEAQRQLECLGFVVSYHCCVGLGHSIDQNGFNSAVNFLRRAL